MTTISDVNFNLEKKLLTTTNTEAILSSKSEAHASELLENIEDTFPRYYISINMFN